LPRSSFENLLANPASGDITLVLADSDGGVAGQGNRILAATAQDLLDLGLDRFLPGPSS